MATLQRRARRRRPGLIPDATAGLATAAGWQQTLLVRADGTVWAVGTTSSTGSGRRQPPDVAPIAGLSLASNPWLVTDGDGDGLAAWEEYLSDVDPLVADTNGNGLSDLVDVRRAGPARIRMTTATACRRPRSRARDDPFNADTDGDSVSDLLDDYPLDPTRSQKPAADPNDTTPPVITLTHPTNARPIGGGQ